MSNRDSIKTWYQVHKWTSLICTLFALLLCLTGLPLIFAHEIDHALGYQVEPPALPEIGQRVNLDDIIADAKTRKPGHAVQFLVGDPDEPDLWSVRLGVTADAPEPSAFYSYDARTGEFLHEYPLRQGFMNVLLRLHVDLFAGLPGMLFLGFMGLLLVISLISGTVLYGYYMRKIRFGSIRRSRSAQVKWLDLHNLLGIVTLVWLLVVSVTGVINTLSVPIFDRWQSTELAEMTAPFRGRPPLAGIVSAQRALDAAGNAAPGMTLGFMAFPGNDFASPHHFVAFMQGATPLTSKLLKPVLIDAQTGKVIAQRDLPGYVSALLVSQPLHFGDYGGLPLKILWAVLDILSIVVLISGLYLWLKKHKVSFETRLGVPMNEKPEATLPISAPKQADGQ
ncbi:PepSY domain-containing protein [Methylobacter sp. BBA5.1]|uniref:PepSY-associated TM helix domain-containing protein n=1 Tax=Methylobacter sp. BBA5.1 TaxID=1495064 RepID=UPI0005685F96|nr:PepSY domain-containing protein [Methylobacter sp. BBA5.1]